MIAEYEDDAHFCLKCHATIIGLDNYVDHRKAGCSRSAKSPLPSQLLPPDDSFGAKADDFFSSLELRSSSKKYEVPSTSGKSVSRILTRSKTTAAIQAKDSSSEAAQSKSGKNVWIGGHQLKELGHGDNESKLIKAVANLERRKEEPARLQVYDDSDDDSDEFDYDVVEESSSDDQDRPPRNYTGGKWKPSSPIQWSRSDWNVPPPSYTGGKWKPPATHTKGKWKPCYGKDDEAPPPTFTGSKWVASKKHDFQDDPLPKAKWRPKSDEEDVPPPNHTKGKWKPKEPEPEGSAPWATHSKELSIMDDSSKRISDTQQYWCGLCNRKLASKVVYERHLKSELHFKRMAHDLDFDDSTILNSKRRTKIAPPEVIFSNQKKEKKRARKAIFERCEVCHSKVSLYLIGKHLISHYHCRRGDITSPAAKSMVLDNIHAIVLESPFQCSICRFYCNTHDDFLTHWTSQDHENNEKPGYFFCSFCNNKSEDTRKMYEHLISPEHLEVVSVINRYIPIIIKKINPVFCPTCNEEFTLNIQLLDHCRELGHGNDEQLRKFLSEYICDMCGRNFLSNVSLKRHREKFHNETYFVCTVCDLKFKDRKEAKDHRNSQEHRYTLIDRKGKSVEKTCEYCAETFRNVPAFKRHLREEHPEYGSRCPLCGAVFSVTQELVTHLRYKACKFQDAPDEVFRCTECLFSAPSNAELLFHGVFHDEQVVVVSSDTDGSKMVSKYKCPICSKLFTKSSLLPHIRQHTEEKPFVCKICGAKFARKNNLIFHVKNHGNVKKPRLSKEQSHLCSVCGAKFKKRSVLQQHMLRHTGKPFKCPSAGCFYSARSASEVKAHFATHLEDKNFKCDRCDYTTKTKLLLQRHQLTHGGEKKFQCTKCNFAALTSSHYKRHVRKHTGAKPFKCPHCEYSCSTLENLRKHILSTTKHLGKSVYECKFCTDAAAERFRTNVAKEFKAHLITSHAEKFPNSAQAATYVSGIYSLSDDNTLLADDYFEEEQEESVTIDEDMPRLKSDLDPVVCQLPSSSSNKDNLDQMFTMFIIPKDEGVLVENPGESWNVVGRYDVEEESGTLIPFQSEEESLFEEHF